MSRTVIVAAGLVALGLLGAAPARAQRSVTTPAGVTSGPLLACRFAGLRNGATFSFAIEGTGRDIRADGEGWFQPGVDASSSFLRNSGVRMYPRAPDADTTAPARVVTVDLGHPVSPDASDLGLQIVDRIVVHWKQDGLGMVLRGPLDVPVGRSVYSQRTEVFTTIDGKPFVLRFGDMDVSVCWPGDAPIFGDGTNEPMLTRTSEREWVLDIPRGSRGRLSQMFGNPVDYRGGGFIDHGLYEVSARIRFRLERIEG